MWEVFNKNSILVGIIKRTYIEGMGPFNEDTKHKGLTIDYHIRCYVYDGQVLRNNFIEISFCEKENGNERKRTARTI